MRNIINLLYRYKAVLLFIVLEVVAFSMYFTYNSYQRASFFNSSGTVVGFFKDVTHTIKEPFTAQRENKELRKENAKLRDLQLKNYYKLEKNRVVINDTLYRQQFTYIPAQVIDNSYNRQKNYIIINAGKTKGVTKEMGVIGPKGIIGFVKDVSQHYALVFPVLNNNFTTAIRLKTTNHFGYISWNGQSHDIAQIDGMINTVPIEEGDTIVTKGASGRFPAGIMVGTVKSVREVAGDAHYQIDINLSTDFTNLYHAYVIVNHHKQEFDEIRDKIPGDE